MKIDLKEHTCQFCRQMFILSDDHSMSQRCQRERHAFTVNFYQHETRCAIKASVERLMTRPNTPGGFEVPLNLDPQDGSL